MPLNYKGDILWKPAALVFKQPYQPNCTKIIVSCQVEIFTTMNCKTKLVRLPLNQSPAGFATTAKDGGDCTNKPSLNPG